MTRVFDILLASLATVALAPLLVPIMIVLRLTGEGEIFYLQERIGKGGKPFRVIKFATMLRDSPNLPGGYVTRRNDPRALPVGRVLRKTKINELPQLFNVLAGQMSFVGPRPQAAVHYALFTEEQQAAIIAQVPGVTGLGSLVFRDEETLLDRIGGDHAHAHDEVITPYKGELEIWYAENRSLGLYFKIILLTAIAIVRPSTDVLRFFPGVPQPCPELQAALQPGSERRSAPGSPAS